MTNSRKLITDKLTNWLMNLEGFKNSQCQIYIFYKYAPDGSILAVLDYVDDRVFWYTYEELGKWSLDTFGKIFRVNLLGYAHWFMFIKISQIKVY